MVLILFSVLLAFWIEARWQAAQDDDRQDAYLEGVAEDLTRIRGLLEGSLARGESWDRASDSLLVTARTTSLPDSTLSELLWRATSLGRASATSVALSGLVASTAWAELENLELRDRFAALELSLRDLDSSRSTQSDYWFHQLDPYLRYRLDYAAWEQQGSVPIGGWPALLEDQAFRNMLTHARWIRSGDGGATRRVLERVDEVLAALIDG